MRSSVGDSGTPIVRVTAVVFEREDTKMVGKNPVVDGVWKARHEVMSNIRLDDTPAFGSLLDDTNRTVNGVKELSAKRRNPSLVKPCRFDEFRFRIRVMDHSHPIARRAAFITSSCARPTTAPEESS